MKGILIRGAQIANAQMRVQSLADRRPDRVVWDGTHWEWAVLRPENGTFDAEGYVDVEAREKWFFQAQIESPAMFARKPDAGSRYWFVYFRIYGPDDPAFDKTWRLPDFEPLA